MTNTSSITTRSVAIDAFRATVMLLMIFVNDFWTLRDIPVWMKHVPYGTDGMGLSDVIFPLFLFITGLSIPFAVQSRIKKGDTKKQLLTHVLLRTLTLMIMGTILVSIENYSKESLLPQSLWEILLVISFFLIWMHYKNPASLTTKFIRMGGVALLIALLFLYKNNEVNLPLQWPLQWLGILGYIGLGYVFAAGIFILTNGKWLPMLAGLAFFIFFSIAQYSEWLFEYENEWDFLWTSQNGALPAFTIAGVLCAIAYKRFSIQQKNFWLLLVASAIIFTALGFITRPYWGISKIMATPSWIAICTGISIAAFMAFIYLTDVKKITRWYNFIKPAGTATLTCYLLPYLFYAISGFFDIDLPMFLRTGPVGLIKSFIFALIVITSAGLLQKRNLHLKL